MSDSPRRVLLVDADAFFVAVARMVDPEGAGRAPLLIVGGTPAGRGVVCSASYETRAFGVRSAMPTAHALRLCPRALVVPVEQILKAPGLVEVRCDPHPWTRGWLFAFDHPYFATTDRDGSFAIDSVPPGRYTLVVWHERGPIVTREVTIAAGQVVESDVRWKAD